MAMVYMYIAHLETNNPIFWFLTAMCLFLNRIAGSPGENIAYVPGTKGVYDTSNLFKFGSRRVGISFAMDGIHYRHIIK
jgi:hypothetical protein